MSLFNKLHSPRLTEILFPQTQSLPPFQSILTISWVLAAATIAGMMASAFLDHENVIMIYLLGVIYLATRCSWAMSTFACVLSVLAFDFFIVPPAFNFIPEDPQYAFTFTIMFVVAMVMSGLTHKVKTQELLIKQSELLDLTYDAIIVWSLKDNEIGFWNSGAQKMFGQSKEQAIGQSLAALLCGEYSEAFKDIVNQAKIDGKWNGEITYKRFDGDPITVASRWTVKFDSAGNPEDIVEFATDITERKIAERRIKEFYSTLSHELRTPLTSIIGGLSLVLHGIAEPASRRGNELISLAKTQADKLLLLINDLLDLQKIEAGQLPLQTSQMKIEPIIDCVFDELAVTAAQVNTSFTKDIGSNPIIEADSTRIAQVLTNLLANAVKFSPPGSEVQAKTERRKDRLRISITDNGPGIESSEIPKLFAMFQQVDSSDTRNHGGTGLGLAISKAIVKQHRGEIGVDSEVGKGSTFWFELKC